MNKYPQETPRLCWGVDDPKLCQDDMKFIIKKKYGEIMDGSLMLRFEIDVKVGKPIVVGQDDREGRRQLIPIIEGFLTGESPLGEILKGFVFPGGVDSQIIRPDGRCELSARYGVKLDNGHSFYIENNGIRTVPKVYASKVFHGEFIDPELYYFCTHPKFEVYHEDLDWLKNRLFVCKAQRFQEKVVLQFLEMV